MKDRDKLFDVVGVNLATHRVRIMATCQTAENADAYVKMAVMRRGVDKEFFAAPPAGLYQDGDAWEGKERANG